MGQFGPVQAQPEMGDAGDIRLPQVEGRHLALLVIAKLTMNEQGIRPFPVMWQMGQTVVKSGFVKESQTVRPPPLILMQSPRQFDCGRHVHQRIVSLTVGQAVFVAQMFQPQGGLVFQGRPGQ